MTKRVQVGELRQAPRKQVQASVVDTFIAPAVDKPQESNMSQLAGALKQFEPTLQKYVEVKAKEETDQLSEKGRQQLRKDARDNLEGFKKGIDAKVIHAGQSPWFQKGYNFERGIYLKRKYAEEVSKGYQSWDENERNSQDPNSFNMWIAKKRTEFNTANNIGENPDILRGFNEGAALTENNINMHHIKLQAERIVDKRNNLMSSNTQMDVKGFQTDKNKDLVLKRLTDRIEHYYIEGGNGKKANELVSNAIIQQAIDTKDIKTIDLLNDLNPSGLGALGTQPKIKKQMQVARDQIKRSIAYDDNQAYIKQTREKKDYADEASSKAFEFIRKDPTARISDEDMFRITREYPDFPKTVEALRKMQTSEDRRENAELTMPIYVGVADGKFGNAYIHQKIREGVLNNPSTVDSLLRTAARVKASGKKGINTGSSYADMQVAGIQKALEGAVKTDINGKFSRTGNTAAGKALLYYRMGMHEFIHDTERDKPLTSTEIVDHANKLHDSLLAMYTPKINAKLNKNVNGANDQAEDLLGQIRGELPSWEANTMFNSEEELRSEYALALEGQPNIFTDALEDHGLTTKEEIKAFFLKQTELLRGR